jgi:hypothetical protein
LYKNGSNIKICFIVILLQALPIPNHILRIENNILLLNRRKKVEFLVVSGIIIYPKKAMLHLHRYIVILLDCNRLLFLHRTRSNTLSYLFLFTHEESIHLLLFFRSYLHRLEMSRECRGTTGIRTSAKAYCLYLVRWDIVHLLYL